MIFIYLAIRLKNLKLNQQQNETNKTIIKKKSKPNNLYKKPPAHATQTTT